MAHLGGLSCVGGGWARHRSSGGQVVFANYRLSIMEYYPLCNDGPPASDRQR